MSSSKPHHDDAADDDFEADMLAEDDAQEVLEEGDAEGDVAMDSDGEEGGEEIELQNDSIAYFDSHKDSVFAIAQHPLYPNLVATGGSEGDADDAPGKGYVIDVSAAASRPVLPPSYNSDASAAAKENAGLKPIFEIDGHTDSINSLAFTLPRGDYLVSGGMDGRLRVYAVGVSSSSGQAQLKFVAESRETEEVNWLAPCPSPEYPNTVALGASDGSVWVFTIDAADASSPIQIVQSYFLHTGPCTAGAWSPDGLLLATVSEDSSLHVFDVWGAAAAKSLVTDNGQTVVSLTDADQRFAVEGGLYSVAVAPSGFYLAVGGAGGAIRIVGLPRLSQASQAAPSSQQQRGARRGGASTAEPSAQAGAILASLNVQQDSIESLAFSPAPQTLLAAGSVDSSIAVFDTARSFAVRRHIRGAHDGESVVKVDFVRSATQPPGAAGWLLTSCGLDGVVRRWDLRGATASQHVTGAAATGLLAEWRGHRGGGEGGGVLGFVQGDSGERVITAGDDALVLVFEA
ncbi:WD40-repeat-containing domain protein [Diplogelasinospora grovesii]|uniref:WD40-repeat-containing domain protein n=1 Tax=Diplogelasinospora grovesii TaxID=303347 RepID=A0AAN6N4F2_9PEZI|nr:WD40-repeat-containing domain protein [Diplogelasinospora grovesii]